MSVSAEEIADVIRFKKDDFLQEKESLSLKQIRRIVEKSLKLEKKALDGQKALVEQLVDQIVLNAAPEEGVQSKASKPKTQTTQAPTGKKRKADVILDDQQGSDEDNFSQPKQNTNNKKAAAVQKRKRVAKEKVLEVDEDSPAPMRSKSKPKQSVAAAAGGKAAAGSSKHDAQVQKLQRVCKAAGITIAPHIYIKNKDPASLRSALQDLLSKHGLSMNSDASKIASVKAKLELAKDMEGIDMSNIIDDIDAGRGGRPSRRAAAKVDYKSLLKPEEESEDEEGDEDDDQNSDDNQSSEDGSDVEASDDLASEDVAAAISDEDEPHQVARRNASNTAAGKKGRLKRAAASESDEDIAEDDELGDVSGGEEQVGTTKQKASKQRQQQGGKTGKQGAAVGKATNTTISGRKQRNAAVEDLPDTDDSSIREEQEEEEEAEAEQVDRDDEEESDFEDVEDDD